MKLFCFAAKNDENIRRGIDARLWAVSQVSDTAMRGRQTKARRYLAVGDFGLLFSRVQQAFVVPFVVRSLADPNRVVHDVWPEGWVLPFRIEPLGDLARRMPIADARFRWPLVDRRWPVSGGAVAALNGTGTCTFSPVELGQEDWDLILRDLAKR